MTTTSAHPEREPDSWRRSTASRWTRRSTRPSPRAFRYDEVTVPPRYEIELLGAKVKRKTVRYRKGQRVACKTWRDFKDLEEKARTYGGEVQFV